MWQPVLVPRPLRRCGFVFVPYALDLDMSDSPAGHFQSVSNNIFGRLGLLFAFSPFYIYFNFHTISPFRQGIPANPRSQIKNKNNFLDRLVGSRPLWGALAGPPKKNKKIFLVVVAHDLFKHVQIQPILLTDKIRKFFMQLVGASH